MNRINMIKKLIFISSLLLLSLTSNAQTVDEVLEMYYQGLGGREKFNSIKSWHLIGNSQLGQNPPGEFQFIYVAPNKMKIKTVIDTFEIVQAISNDSTGWHQIPPRGIVTPTAMTQQEVDQLKGQRALVLGPFNNYKEKGAELTYKGVVMKDKSEYKKLVLQTKIDGEDGPRSDIFLNNETNLIEIIETQTLSGGAPVTFINKLSNYKDIDGLMIPFTYATYVGDKKYTSLDLETIILNKQYEPSIFDMP
ncbi:MAG: hypothetical protein R2863_06525 [Candidatus Kapaibacterium sp.]|nr:hypothetical protein [Ignavibacteriota bacterium]MCB9222308.1 hypothetical protein [Ignavibacteria bacterium]